MLASLATGFCMHTSPVQPLPPGGRILVVDDDQKLCRLIQDFLRPHGYEVAMAHTGTEGARLAVSEPWQAVLLDLMLPGCDGFETLRLIRKRSAVPVLMLTARGDEADRIQGLQQGADDYLPKTFSSQELLARLQAVIRRSVQHPWLSHPARPPQGCLTGGGLWLNLDARELLLAGQPLALTPVEFDILSALARSHGCVKSREALVETLRAREYEVFDRSVDVHIASLRKKLGDDAHEPRYIRTVRSAGYLFIPTMQAAAPPQSEPPDLAAVPSENAPLP